MGFLMEIEYLKISLEYASITNRFWFVNFDDIEVRTNQTIHFLFY
jgi:hypothetical protein